MCTATEAEATLWPSGFMKFKTQPMRNQLLTCSLALAFVSQPVFCQNESIVYANVIGTVTDYDKNIKVGETIIFQNLTTLKRHQAKSDEQGKISSRLPCGYRYSVKIKGFADDVDYAEFEIPDISPDQGEVTIQVDVEMKPGKEFVLDNVYFDTGKSTLKPESYAELNNLVEYMKELKNDVIEISGHTDNVGDPESNQVLSLKRAEAVVAYLVENGIEANRVKAVGYGESRPIASNNTPEGRKINRRTEVKILAHF